MHQFLPWPHPRLAVWVLAALAVIFGSPAVADQRRKPNVIVIFTDDQGTLDAGCYGSDDLQTPAIDGLAERGVRFTQFYAAAPVCSPSRAGLLTGRYPLRAGMGGNAAAPPSEEVNDLTKLGGGNSPWAAQITIAEVLKRAGYATAHIGKWHLNYGPGEKPLDQGFDCSFGHMDGCIDNYSHFFYWNGANRHDLWRNNRRVHLPGQFFPDLMVKEASRFMAENKDHPFFIYFAMNAPHYPYQGTPQWLDTYKNVPYPRNIYNAFVSTLDERIGQLVEQIERLGLSDDTIIIFQSDHGHSTESRAHGGGGNAGPYRGAKFSLFEGGIRVPAIISWPGHLPRGTTRDQLAHGCDWLPTIAELCGVELNQDIDGKSLVEVIRSEDAASPHDVVHWTIGNNWAVRRGDWKLLGNPRDTANRGSLGKDDKLFLSNLAMDKTEMKNFAQQHPQVVDELKELHENWARSIKP